MDTCMDVNEFDDVCEVDHEGTASGFGGADLLPDISASELLREEDSAAQRVAACLAEEAAAEWQLHFSIFQSNQKSWIPYHRNSRVWAFFQLLDGSGGGRVDASIVQTMRCVICHPTSVSSPSSSRTTRSRKGVVNYNHNHGSTSLKKHVDSAHSELYERYVKEMAEKQALETPTSARTKNKKRKSIQASQIVDFFRSKEAYRKLDLPQVNFLQNLVLLIAKGCIPLSLVESQWVRRLVLMCDSRINFPSTKQLVREHIPMMFTKTMEQYVLPLVGKSATVSVTFDLWMSRGTQDTFCMVVNFLDTDWVPRHVTVGVFRAQSTTGVALATIVEPLLKEFNLLDKVIAYVKDEGTNLITLVNALSSVVSCDVLGLKEPYSGTCFGHVMSKVCQYGTNSDTICASMKHVSLKNAQSTLQKTITWTKKSGKGRQEWEKACIEAGLPSRRLKTPVKTRFAFKVTLFQETLEYASAINICYQRQTLQLQARVPSGLTWAIARAVCDILNPVVEACILNQTRGFWLLSDALVSAMTIYVKLRIENNRRELAVPSLEVGSFDSELEIMHGRIAKAGCGVLEPFLDFAFKFSKEKAHNMVAIMLDPRHKSLQSISKFVGPQTAKLVVMEYDRLVLLPLLMQVHMHLNPKTPTTLVQADMCDSVEVDQFALFGARASEEEAAEGLLQKELSLFRRLVIKSCDLEEGPLEWWRVNEALFPCVGFLARQYLGIPGSQIETERIFSVAGILTNLRRSRLGLDNLNNLIMIYKNWPSDSRTDCKLYEHLADFYSGEAAILEENEDELAQEGLFEEVSDE